LLSNLIVLGQQLLLQQDEKNASVVANRAQEIFMESQCSKETTLRLLKFVKQVGTARNNKNCKLFAEVLQLMETPCEESDITATKTKFSNEGWKEFEDCFIKVATKLSTSNTNIATCLLNMGRIKEAMEALPTKVELTERRARMNNGICLTRLMIWAEKLITDHVLLPQKPVSDHIKHEILTAVETWIILLYNGSSFPESTPYLRFQPFWGKRVFAVIQAIHPFLQKLAANGYPPVRALQATVALLVDTFDALTCSAEDREKILDILELLYEDFKQMRDWDGWSAILALFFNGPLKRKTSLIKAIKCCERLHQPFLTVDF